MLYGKIRILNKRLNLEISKHWTNDTCGTPNDKGLPVTCLFVSFAIRCHGVCSYWKPSFHHIGVASDPVTMVTIIQVSTVIIPAGIFPREQSKLILLCQAIDIWVRLEKVLSWTRFGYVNVHEDHKRREYYIINRKGPNTEPCGTLTEWEKGLDVVSSTLNLLLLLSQIQYHPL